jgi:hypothetical protein
MAAFGAAGVAGSTRAAGEEAHARLPIKSHTDSVSVIALRRVGSITIMKT